MQIQRVQPGRIIDLRHRILRAGLPVETAVFDGDHEPTARHYAAIDADGGIIGCVTLIRRDDGDSPAWQLRGMAVDPSRQRGGVGAALLRHAEADVRGDPDAPQRLWCNARVPAVGFYERHGWRAVSDVFDIPTAGPHRRMVRRL